MNYRLKIIRKSMGLTQEQFAGVLNVSLQAYINYENGKRNVTTAILLRLQEFGFSTDWILSGFGSMFLNNKSGKGNGSGDKTVLYIDEKISRLKNALNEMDEEQRIHFLDGILMILNSG